MIDLEAFSLKVKNNLLIILNQKSLPHKEEWLIVNNPKDMISYIKDLKTRGAPLIGVSASLSLAKYSEDGASEKEFKSAANELKESRPTAVNLMINIDRLLNYKKYDPNLIVSEAIDIFNEDVHMCESIAFHGASLIKDGDRILTHCNTGGLATAGSGTALGIIVKPHNQGKKIHVYVDETRPLLQGGRLTTYELQKLGIPYTLICDNMAAFLMAQGKIDKAIVGSDRIALNGDFANKIGTYNIAVLCEFHKIPFYVAAPYTTIDFECPSGKNIPIEERSAKEVKGVQGSFGDVEWAPAESQVYNPSFDITPANLVDSWILDTGSYNYEQIQMGILSDLKNKDN